jgi:hypothetical protein
MKYLALLCCCIPALAFGQQKPLTIAGTAPRFYLSHTVAPKENYYSIGRLYNISPKEIAPFNNLELEKGLSLNQAIRIPLTETNFAQSNAPGPNESLVPVYHVVKEKETLTQICGQYNKIPVESIRSWNKIKGEALSTGSKLIVGYLRVNPELSALAAGNKPATANPAPTPLVKPAPPAPAPVTVKPAPAPAKPDISNETLPVVKKPEQPAKTTENEKPVKTTPTETPVAKKEQPPVPSSVPATTGKSFDGGSFRQLYETQAKKKSTATESGFAAVFKSTSGWEDGKYYCLHNSADPGTIVKVTNKANGKSVYAKVLDVMPDIRQNNDLIIRISNAAAQELGVTEPKFDCTLTIPN